MSMGTRSLLICTHMFNFDLYIIFASKEKGKFCPYAEPPHKKKLRIIKSVTTLAHVTRPFVVLISISFAVNQKRMAAFHQHVIKGGVVRVYLDD